MGSEIPGGPSGIAIGGSVEGIPETAAGAEAAGVEATTAAVHGDAVARVADDLAAGRISGNDAVDLLLAEVMGDDLVRAAPDSVRAELAEVLAALIETDPHLASLARFLGADRER